jgi:hypothetical protein
MQKLSAFAVAVFTVGFVATVSPPASAAESTPARDTAYPVICFQEVLPGGHPLPEICLPWPF